MPFANRSRSYRRRVSGYRLPYLNALLSSGVLTLVVLLVLVARSEPVTAEIQPPELGYGALATLICGVGGIFAWEHRRTRGPRGRMRKKVRNTHRTHEDR